MKKIIAILMLVLLIAISNISAQDMTVDDNGLTVEGNVEIRNGGIIFPDGTVLDNAYLNTQNGKKTIIVVDKTNG